MEAAKRILEELARRPELRDWMDRQGTPRPEDPSQPESRTEPDEPADENRPSEAPDPVHEAEAKAHPGASAQHDEEGGADDDASGGFAGALRALVRSASEAASREAGEHNAALRDWGLRPADLRTVPLEERLEMARMLRTRRMRDLADLLGRMRNHCRASERRKVKANRDEVYDIENSGDIARVLPAERARAFGSKHPNVRRDFFRRLSQRAVPSYSLRTEEPVARGPVIAMIDSSSVDERLPDGVGLRRSARPRTRRIGQGR